MVCQNKVNHASANWRVIDKQIKILQVVCERGKKINI